MHRNCFNSPFKALEAKLIGGVTLNHLCWAALGGGVFHRAWTIYNFAFAFSVPSGLLAFQGNDDQGRFIRSRLKKMGVTTEFIKGERVALRTCNHFYLSFVALRIRKIVACLPIIKYFAYYHIHCCSHNVYGLINI